jgi:hypothetical protein
VIHELAGERGGESRIRLRSRAVDTCRLDLAYEGRESKTSSSETEGEGWQSQNLGFL